MSEVITLEAGNAADMTKTPVQKEWESGKAVLCFGNRRFFDKTRSNMDVLNRQTSYPAVQPG